MSIQGQPFIDRFFLLPVAGVIVKTVFWVIKRWDYLLAFVGFSIAGGYLLVLIFVTHNVFWDIKFYRAVVEAMAAGFSPYDDLQVFKYLGRGAPAGFVYPPLVADLFYNFRWVFLTAEGRFFLAAAYVISWISIAYLLAGSPKRWYSRDFLYVWGLYLVLFGLGGTRLLVVGNISTILFALVVISTAIAVRTRDYKMFWLTLLICSFVKIYFVAFLLMPILLDKKYAGAASFVGALGALYGINYFVAPELFVQYVNVVAKQSSRSIEIGYSFFTLSRELLNLGAGLDGNRSLFLALILHCFLVLTIFLVAYAISSSRVRPQQFDLYCCWLFMSGFLISPRIFDYDLGVVIVPFVLLGRMLLIHRGWGIGIAAIVALFGSVLLRTPQSFYPVALSQWSAAFTIFGVWLGAAVHWLTSDCPEKTDPAASSEQ